jgi:hypothetical protein
MKKVRRLKFETADDIFNYLDNFRAKGETLVHIDQQALADAVHTV